MGQRRNVQSAGLLFCQLDLLFFHVLVAVAVVVCLRSLLTTGTKKILGDRSFASAAPKFWNGLPRSIRNANNLIKFKSLLKTYHFNVAYHN